MKLARVASLLKAVTVVSLAMLLSNCGGGGSDNGVTRGVSQPGVPNITNVRANSTSPTTVTVTWTTDTATTSQVDYGSSTSYGSSSPVDNSMVTSHSVVLSSLTTGATYHFRVRSKDSANAEAVSSDNTFQTGSSVDTTPPSVSVVSPRNGATVSGMISLSSQASDNTVVASVRFLIDGAPFGPLLTVLPYDVQLDTTTLTNGNHTISATATDAAGNATNAAVVNITVSNSSVGVGDSSPPSVAITSPVTGSTVAGTLNIVTSAADNVGVVGVQILVDNANFGAEMTSAPYSIVWNTKLYSNGAHRIEARARDAAGNVGSAAISVAVDNTVAPPPDTTPPTVQISNPGNATNVAGTILLTALATDNIGLAGVQFQVDGANVGTLITTSPYNLALDTTKYSNGAHTITAIAKDTSNNTASATASVNVTNGVPADTTPPAVQITSPANSATVSGSTNITATATDNVAVAGVQFKVDGSNLGAEDTASPYQATVDTTTLSNGTHTISAVARDTSNNTTTVTVSVTVSNAAVVDTTPPTVQVTSPSGGATLTGTATFTATASDNVAVAGVQFQIDGGSVGPEITTTPYQYSLNTGTITNGTHTITAVARDTSNNTATSASVSVTVSNAAAGNDIFAAQCLNDPNIVRCYGFDGPIPQLDDGSLTPAVSSINGEYRATFDTTRAASGAGSMKMHVPASAGPNTSGEFHMDFSDDPFPIQFGPTSPAGNEFYVQFRQYMPSEFVNMKPVLGGGYKHAIINMGSARVGSQVNTPFSCADMEITLNQYYHHGFPIAYHGCGAKDGTYQVMEPVAPPFDYLLQNAAQCQYTDESRCFKYAPDQWMTYQIHIKTGEDYQNDRNYRHDSTYELWMAQEGQPAKLVVSMTDYDFMQHDVSGNSLYPGTWWATNGIVPRYGKIWLIPYETGRCAATFTINSINRTSGKVTVSSAAHNTQNGECFQPGDPITIAGVSDSSFNGSFTVATVIDQNTITYNQAGSNAISASGTVTDTLLLMPDTATWYDSLIVSRRRLPDPGVQTPNAPDSLIVMNDGSKNILTWRDNSDVYGSTAATGFVIERCAGYRNTDCYENQTLFSSVGTVGVVTTWSDNAGTASTAYTYRVKAVNGSGSSAYSNAAMNVPGAVGNVRAIANSSSQVTVTWTQTPPADQTGYSVERCTGTYTTCGMTDANYTVLKGNVAASATSYVDTGVSGGTTYTYRVKALGTAGSYKSWGESYYGLTSYGGASKVSQATTP